MQPPAADPAPAPPARPRTGRLMALAAMTGLAAGLLAWAAGETPAVSIAPAEKDINFFGSGNMVPSISHEARQSAVRQTAARTYGVLGATLGALLGLLGGLTTGSSRRAARAATVGLLLGALLGAGVSWMTLPTFEHRRAGAGDDDMIPSLLMHATFWAPIGAAAGLALALGRKSRLLPATLAGAVAALLAAVAYELLGAALFPLAATGDPVSATRLTRLMAHLLLTTTTALAATRALTPIPPPTSPTASPA